MSIREKIEHRLGGYFDSPSDWSIHELSGRLYAYRKGMGAAILEEPTYYSFLIVNAEGKIEKDRYNIFLGQSWL